MASETPRKTNWTFVEKFTSCRWALAYMLFVLRMFQTALRQSIGMALVCMAERPGLEPGDGPVYNASVGEPSDVSRATSDVLVDRNQTMLNISSFSTVDNSHRREFVWDATFEGVVLSSYYYGYMVTPLISSYTERLVGAKWLVASCLGVGAVVNLFTPELTRANKYLLVALRVVAGTTNVSLVVYI
ncbi:unnamed protein product [Lymnaea stagnalis]|uniref:Major facilitator superfamily (MFS) profile domain-containing protein n=1 Tax=Lymnaea stagnalis TaxID=6523 RepID=A0AAV2HRC9_LYMST